MTQDLENPRTPKPGELTFTAPKGRGKPRRHLADMTGAERREAVTTLGLPAFRADQVSRHYFARLSDDASAWTDIPAALRDDLAEALTPPLMTSVRELTTDAGTTRKQLWRLFDGALVESVLMRYPDRVTMCVSSQAGCGMNCPFCATGQAGLTRNLSTARDRRAGGRRCARARAGRRARWDRSGVQRRLHGHGRAARELQAGRRGSAPAHRQEPRGSRHVGARHHGVDRRARAADARAGDRGHPGDAGPVAARARRRAAQHPRAGQHALGHPGGARRGVGVRRASPTAGCRSSTR